MESLHDPRRTGHFKIFLSEEKVIIDKLVDIIDNQAQYLFEQCPEVIKNYALASPSKAFVSMFIDISSNEEYKKYVKNHEQNNDVDIYFITNINAIRDFHDPVLNQILLISDYSIPRQEEYRTHLYHIYQDQEFKQTELKIVFNKRFGIDKYIEKYRKHGIVKTQETRQKVQLSKSLYLHYVIGRLENYYNVVQKNVDLTPILVLLRNPITYDDPKMVSEKPRQRWW